MMALFDELEARVGVWYEYLYSHPDVPETEHTIDIGASLFDVAMDNERFAALVNGYVKYRQDAIASDREAAAFMLAYQDMMGEVTGE